MSVGVNSVYPDDVEGRPRRSYQSAYATIEQRSTEPHHAEAPFGHPGRGLEYLSVPLQPNGGVDSGMIDPDAAPSSAVVGASKSSPSSHPRLLSLDCFRGLVIAWMIMADEAGPAWKNLLDHAPWDGVHFADFVFPAFVFIVGMAIPLSTRKFASDRVGVTKKAFWRSIKMFIVGWISASGGFPHPANQDDPGQYQLNSIRIPGILQRIAFCYLINVCMHVWIPIRSEDPNPNSIAYGRSRFGLLKKYLWHWLCAFGLIGLYLILTFGTNVPNCGYGHLDEDCNASGYWDRTLLGLSHMYNQPTYQRTVACQSSSPPDWCFRPYDPEGVLGSFTACVTGFFGMYFGWVLVNETKHIQRIKHWGGISLVTLIIGIVLHFTCIPLNKNLWSLSFVFLMAGVDGIVFIIFYWIVDMQQIKTPLWPLICMGSNAILVFVFAQSDAGLDTWIQYFYLNNPTDNLYTYYRVSILNNHVGDDLGTFLWGCTKIIAWLIISVILYRRKIFWKL